MKRVIKAAMSEDNSIISILDDVTATGDTFKEQINNTIKVLEGIDDEMFAAIFTDQNKGQQMVDAIYDVQEALDKLHSTSVDYFINIDKS